MRATTRYWIVLLVAGLLVPSLHSAASQPPATVGMALPFLTQVTADVRGGRMLEALSHTLTSAYSVLSPSVSAAPRGATPLVALTSMPDAPAVTTVARDGGTSAVSTAPRPAAKARVATPAARANTKPLVVRVQGGQTLWSLASTHGTSVDAIAAANNLTDADRLRVGQRLVIPAGGAAAAVPKHTAATQMTTLVIRQGQTLWDVSRAYGVSINQIVAMNGLSSADYVRAGQRLSVPLTASAVSERRPIASQIMRALPPVASSAVRGVAEGFVWPARGVLTSRFGWRWRRHHDGVDIAAPRGSPIAAARAGVVVFSGWYYGYGRTVMIDHGNGVRTIYGHASSLLVRVGEWVRAGEIIARVGSTGNATGAHLHFEVRINGQPVNPLKYL